jgi:hypothetical protein
MPIENRRTKHQKEVYFKGISTISVLYTKL